MRICRSSPGIHGRHPDRSGLSLLEVVVSVTIFVASLTAILQLLSLANDSRLSAALDADAALRCESLMAEYLSGIRDLAPTSSEPFEDDDTWTFTTSIEPADGDSLLKVTVIVEHTVNENTVNSYFQLQRLVRDPQMFLDAAMSSME